SPDCAACPLGDRCRARAESRVGQLPVKAVKTAVTSRWFNYLCIRCNGELLLSKRTGNDIWMNLYEFPLIETDSEMDFSVLSHTAAFRELLGDTAFTLMKATKMSKHQLSHRTIHSTFYELEVSAFPSHAEKFLRVDEGALGDYAVSRLTDLYLERR
ncbi:MAG: NUDIX domain-containing protein, partial [Rikenellaceae bacterium]|nr:NUDIX domain-containing protein [Rikenellaceae bacterium]